VEPGAEEVFGYTEDEALGESLDLIIPERFRGRHWEAYEQAMERGETAYDRGERLSVPATRKAGERISVEFTVALVRDADGDLAGIAAVLRDVTEQWEARQQREERIQKLEERTGRLESSDPE
jgi:PAS domain S-box-containing protein